MMKELENKNVEEIRISDVPSLKGIKSKMDFSRNNFRSKVEVSYFKRQVTFASFMSSFVTLIICLVMVFAVHMISNRIDAGYDVNDKLTESEIEYILQSNEIYKEKYSFCYELFNFRYLYLFEASNKDLKTKQYYYKIDVNNNEEFVIHINDKMIKVDNKNEFGLLCSASENSRIEFEIEYNGVKKYYGFSN